MKILYISSSTIPSRTANSIHVMKMCQAFAENGHEVVLVAHDKEEEFESDATDCHSFYGVGKQFEIITIPWYNIPCRSLIYGFLSACKAWIYRSDIVYSRFSIGGFFAAVFRIPVIIECHTPPQEDSWIKKKFFKLLIKCSCLKKIIVITHSLKDYFRQCYPNLNIAIEVIPDGSDPCSPGLKAAKLTGAGKKLQVGYVGHLYKGKGMELISRLVPLCPHIDFHVFGGMESDIEFWKDECREYSNITFHGHVQHAKIREYILAFDVVLLPNQRISSCIVGGANYIEKWTSPLKLFEYMSARKPIIASDLPVLREILEHERNALLCPPDDVHAWVRCLELLRDEPDLGKRLAEAAYDDFITKYTWTRRAQTVLGDCT